MQVPPEIMAKYEINDTDTLTMLKWFNESLDSEVLEVGSHDEPIADILSDMGVDVHGIDLREYNPTDRKDGGKDFKCEYKYHRADFCDIEEVSRRGWLSHFDCVISVSALEHFGLTTYGEWKPHAYYDVIASRMIWNALKWGGVAYISVPFGREHMDVFPHWRVYDGHSLGERLVQDFTLEMYHAYVAADCEIRGKKVTPEHPITFSDAQSYSGNPPHVSVLLKLRKDPIKRISPDGR